MKKVIVTIVFMILFSGCSTEAAKVVETTKQMDWEKVCNLAEVEDCSLVQAAYETASIPRGADGYPDPNGTIYPWEMVVGVAQSETNTKDWGTFIDVRQPGPWGYSQPYYTAFSGIGEEDMKYKCQEGLDRMANYLGNKYPERYSGIQGYEIYGSDSCAIGRTQVLANHFASGGIYEKMQNLDVWEDPKAIAEATLIHLVGKESTACSGMDYVEGKDVQMTLCTYNPIAWEDPGSQWYFEGINVKAQQVLSAFSAVEAENSAEVVAVSEDRPVSSETVTVTNDSDSIFSLDRSSIEGTASDNGGKNTIFSLDREEIPTPTATLEEKSKVSSLVPQITEEPTVQTDPNKLLPPITGTITISTFYGTYPYNEWTSAVGLAGTIHQGLDMMSEGGVPVAACDGMVTVAGYEPTVRGRIYIQCDNGLELRYYHLNDGTYQNLSNGDSYRVSKGTPVGMLAPTGDCGTLCEGQHLHFEVWTPEGVSVDPYYMIDYPWSQ